VTPFRRFTLRTDGFASVHAGADLGEMVTYPLRFSGEQLLVNLSTSAGGSLRVEIQEESGQPIPGFTLKECKPLVGDAIEMPVRWGKAADVAKLAGTPVRLRFVLQEADLFAMRFGKKGG
jgi:hypothetical protein